VKGDDIHNILLAEPIEKKALQLGAKVEQEFPIRVGSKTYFGDLFIQHCSQRILIEIEMSEKRIANDLIKAEALNSELWIVVPNKRVAQSVSRKLSKLSNSTEKNRKFIFYFSQAIQRLEDISGLITNPMKNKKE